MFEAHLSLLLLRVVLQKLQLILLEGVSVECVFLCDFPLENLSEHGDMLDFFDDIVECLFVGLSDIVWLAMPGPFGRIFSLALLRKGENVAEG